jgi:hypothetical protein
MTKFLLLAISISLASANPPNRGEPATGPAPTPRVVPMRTPQGGLQPQAVVDDCGTLHLIYFKGEPAGGDLFYLREDAKGRSEPIRVNSQPGSVIARGVIRGGQLALGREGRVHVVWNGSPKAKPLNPSGGLPMLYTRMNDAGTAFEPQRNLMQASDVLDGGGTLAADRAGNVYVSWHALKAGGESGEERRQVWLAASTNDGNTFASERTINDRPTGACGCCGMRGFATGPDGVYFLYRAATHGTDRDMTLLFSGDAGTTFNSTLLDKWSLNACPMSSEAFVASGAGVIAAWETQGKIRFGTLGEASSGKLAIRTAPGNGTKCKHPSLAVNRDGILLLVWTEGTGWQKGGDLAWQLYSQNGQPIGEPGKVTGGIPVGGLATAVARTDGSFTIIH